ncbi:toll/interleukin-1 receptor domain-containing protein [Actinoplanes sp. NEAU-A12]|uniref:Toll/interleukin-1 receptor domain-containing protein n=1 Tax=Actinoplanes sandaracinus TaxID=3045177 RepID=A0ABT6WY20_9ACTN|nr:toll/interleukin-1 receptor domain-containing protein [Actinoplanes sandaracinus]MDI6104628.1 toll/interleukin-1 receptor domain-containing protein [Actinoplanes sandaracinus]
MSGIFVNYRTGDDDFAAALVDDHLRGVFGEENVFRDSRSLTAGTDFPPELWRRLMGSKVLLVLIGPRWLTLTHTSGGRRVDRPDDFVRREIEAAFAARIRVIPVLLNGAPLPAAEDLPASLRGLTTRQAVSLRQRESGKDLGHLVEVLSALVKPREKPAEKASGEPAGDDRHSVSFQQGGVYLGPHATVHGGNFAGRDQIVRGDSS